METATQTALVLAVQAGDTTAFETLVGPYRQELLVHCYRMLGSFHDAEDWVQETLLRAWEKRATFSSPGSYRAWLYRIATNLCLNALSRSPRRSLPSSTYPATDPTHPLPPGLREQIWLEPFPDELLFDGKLVKLPSGYISPFPLSIAPYSGHDGRCSSSEPSLKPLSRWHPPSYNHCWTVMWRSGSKRTSLDSWRSCERTPGLACRRFPPGSREEQRSKRSFGPPFSLSLENGDCFQHEPMPARLTDSTSGRPEQTPISLLA